MIEMTNTINGVQYLQEDGILYISHTGNCYRRASYSEIYEYYKLLKSPNL